jgi:hypothetical protein
MTVAATFELVDLIEILVLAGLVCVPVALLVVATFRWAKPTQKPSEHEPRAPHDA